MVVHSQSEVSHLEDLLRAFSPSTFERDFFVAFTGYIDDSGDGELFTLSCVLAEGLTWTWIEVDWKNLLDVKNRELRRAGRREITRYKAADCSSCTGEFSGWSIDEQKDFTCRMLDIFKRQSLLDTVAFSVNLRELKQEWPWAAKDPRRAAHSVMLTHMMIQLGEQFAEAEYIRDIRITLFHDRSLYDHTLLASFNRLKDNPTFSHAKHFTTLAPMSWEDCIPLQAADLLAYENFKEAERTKAHRKRRYTLNELLEMKSFSGRSRGFTRQTLELLASEYRQTNMEKR